MLNLTKPFEEFVSLWKSETKDIKIKNPDLLFLVVYPDKLEWDFGIEKQTQTTTFMISGGLLEQALATMFSSAIEVKSMIS